MYNTDLPALDRRAASLGVYTDDAEAWGAAWPSILLRRLDDAIFVQEQARTAERRLARARGVAA